MIEGEEIEINGINNYEGQTLKLKLDGVQTGDGNYIATFVVTDEEGNIVATVTTDSEVSLEDSLRDSSGQLVTDSENYISRVGLEISRDPPRGIAELLPGTTLMEAVCTPNGPIYHITQCNTGQVCRNGACMENN